MDRSSVWLESFPGFGYRHGQPTRDPARCSAEDLGRAIQRNEGLAGWPAILTRLLDATAGPIPIWCRQGHHSKVLKVSGLARFRRWLIGTPTESSSRDPGCPACAVRRF